MKFIYVIENERRFQKQLVEAAEYIDPNLQFRFFDEPKKFIRAIKFLKKKGPEGLSEFGYMPDLFRKKSEPASKNSELVLVILKDEFLPKNKISFLKKLNMILLKYHLCLPENMTSYILTRFDSEEAKVSDLYRNPNISNIIYKPFDELILRQHLTFAIEGHHKPSQQTLAIQKTSAKVEMLKPIEMEALSEVGFISISDRQFELNSHSKYYSQLFVSDQRRSIFARLRSQIPHPGKPGMFLSFYIFLGTDKSQITQLRKRLKTSGKVFQNIVWRTELPPKEATFVIIDHDEPVVQGIEELLTKRFENARLIKYISFSDLLSDLDPTMLEGNQTAEKVFSESGDIVLLLDKEGRKILSALGANSRKPVTIFGATESEYKGKDSWLSSKLKTSSILRWKDWIRSPQPNQYFPFMLKEKLFLLRFQDVNINENNDLSVKVQEASKEEKSNWIKSNSILPSSIEGIFVSNNYFSSENQERWEKISEACRIKRNLGNDGSRTKLYLLSNKLYSSEDERAIYKYFEDIFYKPLDRPYIYQKLCLYSPQIKMKGEPALYPTIIFRESIKAANTVDLKEVSEGGIVMEYPRNIPISQFREFILWSPNEASAPEVLGKCNYIEENPETKLFECHFVFFGLNDSYLKSIRLWMRDSYIQSKKQAS